MSFNLSQPRPKYHSTRRYRPDRDIVSLMMYKRRLAGTTSASLKPMLYLRIKSMEKVIREKRNAVASNFDMKISTMMSGLNRRLAEKIKELRDKTSLTIECKKAELEKDKQRYLLAYDQNVSALMSSMESMSSVSPPPINPNPAPASAPAPAAAASEQQPLPNPSSQLIIQLDT